MGFFSKIFSAIKDFFTSTKTVHISSYEESLRYPNGYDSRSIDFTKRYPTQYYNSSGFTSHADRFEHTNENPCDRSVIATVQPPMTFLQMEQLDEYPLPSEILAIERSEKLSSESEDKINVWLSRKHFFRTLEDLYIPAYKQMAFFEEAVETLSVSEYNIKRIKLKDVGGKEFSFITQTGSNLLAAIDDKQLSRFTLKSKSSVQLNGKIKRRESETIFVELYPAYNWRCDDVYDVYFQVNRNVYQLQHNALNFIKKHRLFPILIKNHQFNIQHSNSSLPQRICPESFNPDDDLNDEQMQAIECIVTGEYHPLPYLLYGPPGTGKTKTVVAAIERIVRTTRKNILVCAQSNAACNEIAERLAKVLTVKEMLRMFSQSYDHDQISPTIHPFCNLFDGELKYPALDYLYKYRVLICTLATSGCLVRARTCAEYNQRHFGYVFIDECASAHETMSLIPIAGLCTSVGQVHSNIVLIGDPKQLDAVTKSDWSTEMGFKTSWFEQLFNTTLYKRHETTGEFNSTYITQLVKNYRSHRAILRIPNQLFYENSLEAIVTPEIIRLQVEGLLSKNFPIIFKSVHGYSRKTDDDTSSFNMEECNAVMDFIDELLITDKYHLSASDIGVVSPYKLQCKKIQQRCKKSGYNEIRIGSAETFQGQERKAMIISTVQSGQKTLGKFLMNPQRFNVMITRAKSLLIVVGNPQLLSQDDNWSTFITFCYKNRSLIQGKWHFRPRGVTPLWNQN